MCGIFGHFNPAGGDRALAERMARVLAHRGPDGYGTYHSGPLAFGAGRLAIIDLSADAGPIFSEDRRVAVVYNGEIYNYKSLRAELEKIGHHFATGTDTEVIVHGYESWGAGVIERLRGMFALCIWDEPEQRLLLARDRLGEKPLYYARFDDTFLFASEAKALFEHPGLLRAVNTDALPFYLTLGYTPPPLTMFAGVEKLAPGEMMLLDRHGIHRERYWQPVMDTTAPIPYDEAVKQVRQALFEAVEMRLMSDVPVGAFLSGGLDSTAVVAIMSRAMNRPVQTFTVGFDLESGTMDDAKFNVDARHAAQAAQFLGTEHHAITIRQNESVAQAFPHFIYAMDEPVAQHAIIQTAYVAALARSSGVPVLLSGDASDELFLGYPHYRADRILERYLRVPALLRKSVFNPILERLPSRFDSARKLARKSRDVDPLRRYLEWMRIIGVERLPALLNNQQTASKAYNIVNQRLAPLLGTPRTNYFADRIAFTSLNLWIAEDSNMRVDKMSMLMSTEARAPFEDHHLVELALTIPLQHKLRHGDFKAVLKSAVADLVPRETLSRPKWGFVPPSSQWLRTVLRPLVDTYLSRERVVAVGYFQPKAVASLVEAHMSKRSYELWPLWSLLVFHLWHALYIERDLVLEHQLTPPDLMPDTVLTSMT
jgi:asparagine synthase (glutamine-hydrolysing)